MDFLDPRNKRSRRRRLFISYFAMTAAVVVGTVILAYAAYGYSFNRSSGDITQNGLLFVSSKPSAADIYLNDKQLPGEQTSARLNLPAGQYNVLLRRTGYFDWQRHFTLKEHSIVRFVYPLLIPKAPRLANLQTYANLPSLISQSPDHRWLLVQAPAAGTLSLDLYDTAIVSPVKQTLVFPASLFTNFGVGSAWREIEWASDNRHLLIAHDYLGGSEYIMLDREAPGESVNLNAAFGLNPTSFSLRDKKFNQLYIYDQTAQTLRQANLTDRSVGQTLVNGVLAFKSYGPDLINYVSEQNEAPGKAAIRIWHRGNSYRLYEVSKAPAYLMDAAQFQGHWYYIAGSSSQNRINIYKDPLNFLTNEAIGRAVPLLFFDLANAQKASFSDNGRFAGIQGGANFATYDLETDFKYTYQLSLSLVGPLRWLDGHRYVGQSHGNIVVVDYDGTNQQLIGTSLLAGGGYLDRNATRILSVTPLSNAAVQLLSIDLRAGQDLPR